jgi:multidrug resistance protein, MATE family
MRDEQLAVRLPDGEARPAAPPAQEISPSGQVRIRQRTIMALALPLMANSAVQIVLNLTDIWFVGHISTEALAAVGSVQWLSMVVAFLLGGAATAVQTLVAQAQGAGDYPRAARAVWISLWAVLAAAPLFILVGAARHLVLAPAGISPQIAELAGQFWFPRVGGAFLGAAVWTIFGFFNGIGRPRTTLVVTCVVAVSNAIFNQWFIFGLKMGIAGSGWASTAAQAVGVAIGIAVFLSARYRRVYQSHRSWRPQLEPIWQQVRLGFPIGLASAGDLLGFAIFQIMEVRLGTIGGAATQVVMMMTSISYSPGYGLAASGTTLVGQSIGAGHPDWAMRLGNRLIWMTACYMGGIGLLLALAGPYLLPLFAGSHDALAGDMVGLAARLLWFAAAYQFFDGLAMGSAMALRGAGDVVVAAALVLPLSMLLFLPLAHMLTFAPGQGWTQLLPQLGWGAIGGWVAILAYLSVLSSLLMLRWQSGAWRRIGPLAA